MNWERIGRAQHALERWLAHISCDDTALLSDRLLARTIQHRGEESSPETGALLAHATEILSAALDRARVENELTDVLIIRWAALRAGDDRLAGLLGDELAQVVKNASRLASSLPEPARSSLHHWAGRNGYQLARIVGAVPVEPQAALLHALHQFMFAADYGLAPLPEDGALPPALRRHDDYVERLAALGYPRDADLVGETLIVELMRRPPRTRSCEALLGKLLATQEPDGSLALALDEPRLVEIHHAACVGTVAFSWARSLMQ